MLNTLTLKCFFISICNMQCDVAHPVLLLIMYVLHYVFFTVCSNLIGRIFERFEAMLIECYTFISNYFGTCYIGILKLFL